jgi:hypothetical protein
MVTPPGRSDALAELIAAGNVLEELVRMATLDPRRRAIVQRWERARRNATRRAREQQRIWGAA